MMEFYNRIENADPNRQNLALTVVEGQAAGEKALVIDRRLAWESSDEGYFTEHREEIEQILDHGLVSVGGQKVFCELLGGEKKLVICGGGHVSIPIIRMGLMVGFHVTVLEDRPMFADNARRAGASQVICESFAEGLKKIEGDRDTFFVIVTRGHRYDQACLESVVRKQHAYIGMIGSRRRAALVKELVIEAGGDADVVNRVHSPIGLNIGAETPEEIAVCIIAQIIEAKNRKKLSGGYSKEMLRAILETPQGEGKENADASANEGKIMTTIVARRGSAPRAVGTKMLVLPDGRCVGTIGGGCAEAEVLRKALWMLRSQEPKTKLCQVNMTGKDAEEEGMVCGGVIDVFLESV